LYISPGAAQRAISLLFPVAAGPPRLAPAAVVIAQQGNSPPLSTRKDAVRGLVPHGGHGHGGVAGPAAGAESTASLEKMETRPFLPIFVVDGWIDGMQAVGRRWIEWSELMLPSSNESKKVCRGRR